MDCLNFWSSRKANTSGWKLAARINCVVLTIMSVVLVSCLIAATAQQGGISKVVFFHDGDCDGGNVSQVNMHLEGIVLLLTINTAQSWAHADFASFQLASSNFFMQVLNSPSREEVNRAHFKGSWLGIGISSVRNAFMVSKFKTFCWMCLLISSIPIHLLFNSTIFETDRRESDFHMTIATEDFLSGGPYYPPGSSLALPGFMSTLSADIGIYTYSTDTGFGLPEDITEFADGDSEAMKNISTAAFAATRWERLEIRECKQEYIYCSGLKHHRSVVLIVDKPGGWIRNDMWHLMDNQSELWDHYVPPDRPNHLFFDAQCIMFAARETQTHCRNSCIQAFNGNSSTMSTDTALLDIITDWQYPFFDNYTAEWINGTTTDNITVANETWLETTGSTTTSGLQPGTYDLSVKYCLAEPLDRICHIALSPTLLLSVTLCVIFKTCTAIVVTIVLSRRNQEPLVTLGDAMESFIEKPDPVTAGMCTAGQSEIRRAMRFRKAVLLPGPRQWQASRYKPRAAAIPITVWLTSYLLFALGISVCGYFFAQVNVGNGLLGTFFESEQNMFIDQPFTLIEGVLISNSPQLLLSFCYLAFNNLFTRLQMAREWSLFSEGYHPLRVTDPKACLDGCTVTCFSIFLHWLLSNTIYLFVSTGGYFGTDFFIPRALVDSSLPPNTAIAVGYSAWSLLVMLVLPCILIIGPLILSFRRLPSNMVRIGCNSLALSAACHASRLSHATPREHENSLLVDSPAPSRFDLPRIPLSPQRSYSPLADGNSKNDEIEMQIMVTHQSSHQSLASRHLLLDRADEDIDDDDSIGESVQQERGPFWKLARSKIRWGVVRMPPEWYTEYENGDGPIEHLSFGVAEDDVRPPEPGRFYA
ncbi:hypothetical protein AAE478_006413 [Parahypoxylon ruwenzoriense]